MIRPVLYLILGCSIYIAALSYAKVPVGGIVLGFGDMAQGSYHEDVPFFKSRDHVKEWTKKHKRDEWLFTQLKKRQHELWEDAHDKHVGWMLAGQQQTGNMYYDQYVLVGLAVKIMGKDMAQVGSSVYMGEMPWRKL